MPATDLPPSLHHGAGSPPPPIPQHRVPLARRHHRFFPILRDHADHPRQWRFPDYLNPQTPWVAALRSIYDNPLSFPSTIAPEAGLMLHAIVRNARPRTVVEVGTFLGVSTIWIAAALEAADADPPQNPPTPEGRPRGLIHCFDDFGPIRRAAWRDAELVDRPREDVVTDHLRAAGLAHRAVLHKGDSSVEIRRAWPTLRGWPEGQPPPLTADPARHTGGVDLAFIDGDHTAPGVLQDLWAVEPVLNTGGYLVLHDIFPEQCGDHLGPRHVLDHTLACAQGLYERVELYTAPLNYGIAVFRRLA